MKKILLFSLLLCSTKLYAQQVSVVTKSSETNVLFVVQLDDKSFETQNEKDSNNKTILQQLNPNWIESVEVFKGEKAIEKFGEKGAHGVVLIDLKKQAVDKIPVELSNRFQ